MLSQKYSFFIFGCLAQLKILVRPNMIFKLTKKKKEKESLPNGVNCFMPILGSIKQFIPHLRQPLLQSNYTNQR